MLLSEDGTSIYSIEGSNFFIYDSNSGGLKGSWFGEPGTTAKTMDVMGTRVAIGFQQGKIFLLDISNVSNIVAAVIQTNSKL